MDQARLLIDRCWGNSERRPFECTAVLDPREQTQGPLLIDLLFWKWSLCSGRIQQKVCLNGGREGKVCSGWYASMLLASKALVGGGVEAATFLLQVTLPEMK